jgi:hypothetical protein
MYWFVLSSFTVAASPFAAEYLAGESGLLTTLGYALAATWLLYRLNKRSQPKLSVAAQSA